MKKLLILAMLSLSLFAKEDYRVAVLYWSMNIDGQVAMRKGLEAETAKINEEAKKSGKRGIKLIKFVAGDGELGIEKQIRQFEDAISMKVDAIVVQPTDNAALAEPLRRANKNKIPVIAYDQYISGGKLDSFVTSDNYQAGVLNAEIIASRLKHLKPIKLAIVEYPYVSSTVQRVDGLIDTLDKLKVNYKIVKRYEAVEPKEGKKVGKAILSDFPKRGSLDAIFTVNDGGGLAVLAELKSAKRDDILLATVDGDPRSIGSIKEGKLHAIDSAQFCGPMGATAIKTAYDRLENKKIGKEILLPVFPITKETLSSYPGWQGPIPQSFKKPWGSTTPVWSNSLKVRD